MIWLDVTYLLSAMIYSYTVSFCHSFSFSIIKQLTVKCNKNVYRTSNTATA